MGSDEVDEETHDDSKSGDNKREHNGRPSMIPKRLALCTDYETGTGSFSERAKEIGSHTGYISNIVTDIISDCGL